MTKIISAGIIVKCKDKYVIGHVTGNEHYDIFKGRAEEGETILETAIRECYEESSFVFKGSQLKYLGLHDFNNRKNLAIFIGKIDNVDLDSLHCKASLDDKAPEMDFYELVSFDEMLSKVSRSMNKYLKALEKDIVSF